MSLEKIAEKELERQRRNYRQMTFKRRAKRTLYAAGILAGTLGVGFGGFEAVKEVAERINKHNQQEEVQKKEAAYRDSIDTAVEKAKENIPAPKAPTYPFLTFECSYGPFIGNQGFQWSPTIRSVFMNEHILVVTGQKTPEVLDESKKNSSHPPVVQSPTYATVIYDLAKRSPISTFTSGGVPQIIDSGDALYWTIMPAEYAHTKIYGKNIIKSDRKTFEKISEAPLPTSHQSLNAAWTANNRQVYYSNDWYFRNAWATNPTDSNMFYIFTTDPFAFSDSTKQRTFNFLLGQEDYAFISRATNPDRLLFDTIDLRTDTKGKTLIHETFPLTESNTTSQPDDLFGNEQFILLQTTKKNGRGDYERTLHAYNRQTYKLLWEKTYPVIFRDLTLTDRFIFLRLGQQGALLDAQNGREVGWIPDLKGRAKIGISGDRAFISDNSYVHVYQLNEGLFQGVSYVSPKEKKPLENTSYSDAFPSFMHTITKNPPAENNYQQIIQRYGSTNDAIDAARGFLITGDTAAVGEITSAVLHLNPNNPAALFVEANLLENKQQLGAAIKAYQQVIEHSPIADHTLALAYFRLGNLYEQQGKKSDAKKKIAAAREIEPDNATFRIKEEQLEVHQ